MTKLIGKECKFVVHVPTRNHEVPDVHIIKELLWMDDGTRIPNVRIKEDYIRPFYVTKPSKQNHTESKEWESLENVMRFESTQSNLRIAVARALGKPWSRDSLRRLTESPYVYGTEISSCSLIKKEYMERFPECVSAYTVAGYDIETDVVHGTGRIIMASTVFKRMVKISVEKEFARGFSNFIDMLYSASKKYLQDMYEEGYEFEFFIDDDSVAVVKRIFGFLHEWKPDFLEIWNITFDIPETLKTLESAGINPADVLCDPDIPEQFRLCSWEPDDSKKTTASGKVKPLAPQLQWHTLVLSASFYVVDGMCAYKHIRLAEQEQSSYSLEAIMNLHLNRGKLKHEVEGVEPGTLAWHVEMQAYHKTEYACYNGFDSIGMLKVDEVTKDLQFTMPNFSASSEFKDFKSQPRRICDAFHFYVLEQGYVLGSPGPRPPEEPVVVAGGADEDDDEEDEDEDDDVNNYGHLGLAGWISTLPSHQQVPGLRIIEEDPNMTTGFRGFTYDSDAVSAYPSATDALNVSKDTTKYEISDIKGVDTHLFKMQNMNLLYGKVNAVEYCTSMFQMPGLDEMLDDFVAAHP